MAKWGKCQELSECGSRIFTSITTSDNSAHEAMFRRGTLIVERTKRMCGPSGLRSVPCQLLRTGDLICNVSVTSLIAIFQQLQTNYAHYLNQLQSVSHGAGRGS